jgi:hypothetical protein
MIWVLLAITALAIGLTIANHKRKSSAIVVEDPDGRKHLDRVSPPDPKDVSAFDFMIWLGWAVVMACLALWSLL